MPEIIESLQPAAGPSKAGQPSLWRACYDKTVWESDKVKLLTEIHAAEAALFDRWQELGSEPGHEAERDEMKAASVDLLAIKIHKLGWPDPCAPPRVGDTER